MSYEIGPCSGGDDLLTKIKNVAVTKGWVEVHDAPFGADRWLVLLLDGVYFHLLYSATSLISSVFDNGRIRCAFSRSFNANLGFDNRFINPITYTGQVGKSNLSANDEPNMLTQIGTMTSYRIFSGTNFLHVVAELTPGFFSYLSMGKVTKYGAYTGGHYMSASIWSGDGGNGNPNVPDSSVNAMLFDDANLAYCNSTLFYADIPQGPWFYSTNTSSTGNSLVALMRQNSGKENIATDHANRLFQVRSPNAFNQIAVLQPSCMYVYRANGLASPVGEVPDFRPINITNYNAGDVITLGADEWHVFPAAQKTATWGSGTSNIKSSGLYGFAFKKVD